MKKSWVYLILILLLATLLRVYQLDRVPPSLFGDEIDVGYQAYSILKTGQDIYGQNFPVLIHSLSEYRAPLFIYSDVPFVAIFGLNEWGVRLAATFWGILGILGIYLLAGKLFNKKIGLLSAFFLTISPWHIQYSRAGFEVTMLLSFLIFGTYFFLKGLEKKWWLVLSGILFALTPYIYSTAVVFMPLLVMLLLLIYRKEIFMDSRLRGNDTVQRWIPFLAGMIMVIILIPYLFLTLAGKSGERFSVISIFGNKSLNDQVLLNQKNEQLSFGLQKLFFNKHLAQLNQFSINYLRAFSPEFLFLQGDPNQRQSVQTMGEMYFYELVLLLVGLWMLLSGEFKKGRLLVFGWLLLAPVPASLTYDGGFHATRDFIILVPLMVLLAIGAEKLWQSRKYSKSIILSLVMLLAVVNFVFYLNRYFVNYPRDSWRSWQFGFKQSMQYVGDNSDNYSKILINNTYEPSLERFLFWTKYDPARFHQQFTGDKMMPNITTGFDGFNLENKYYFGKVNGPFENLIDNQILYVASARDDITNPETLTNKNVRLLETVYSPTGEPVFYILSGVKNP